MGHYTDFHFNLRLKDDIPGEILEVIRFMIWDYDERDDEEQREKDLIIPNHELFKLENQRWKWMLRNYGTSLAREEKYKFLTVLNMIKNYQKEIEHFLNWITPYIHEGYREGDCLGTIRYECFPVNYVYYRIEGRDKPMIEEVVTDFNPWEYR